MRLHLWTVVVALEMLLSCAWPANAEHNSKSKVRDWIVELGSTRFAKREAASRALNALGAEVLPALHTAAESRDPEIRRRAVELSENIRRRLERDRILAGPRVHVVLKGLPLARALAEFNVQTGLSLEYKPDPPSRTEGLITLDTGETTVWNALEQFCHSAGLSEVAPKPGTFPTDPVSSRMEMRQAVMRRGGAMASYVYASGRVTRQPRLMVTDGKVPALPSYTIRAVRLRAMPPGVGVRPSRNRDGEKVLGLELCSDPKLPWSDVLRVRIDRAVDEHGNTLTQTTQVATAPQFVRDKLMIERRYGTVTLANARYLSVRLKVGKTPASRLKELHGVVSAEVQTPPEPVLRIDNILKANGQEAKTTGTKVKIENVQRLSRGQVMVRLELSSVFANSTDLRRRLLMGRRIIRGGMQASDESEGTFTLEDTKGSPLRQVALRCIPIGRTIDTLTQAVTLTCEPGQGQGEPAKLVYRAPRQVVIDIPFTLKDVPLP